MGKGLVRVVRWGGIVAGMVWLWMCMWVVVVVVE